jgi:hypothetical protein
MEIEIVWLGYNLEGVYSFLFFIYLLLLLLLLWGGGCGIVG